MNEAQAKKMHKLFARCWADPALKSRLLADPLATLKAEGIDINLPPGMQMRAVENTDKVFNLVVPAKPRDMSDEDLNTIAAGGDTPWWWYLTVTT